MKKEMTLILSNSTKFAADVVLFDCLKNAANISNTYNTFQNGIYTALPINSIEGLLMLLANQANANTGGNLLGLTYFDLKGNLNFNVTAMIQGVTTKLNQLVISTKNNNYFQFLESLKTQSIKIYEANIQSNISPLADENWRIVKTAENGESSIHLLDTTKAITPYTVNNYISILKINKLIDKFTGIVVNVLPLETKSYTFSYSIL